MAENGHETGHCIGIITNKRHHGDRPMIYSASTETNETNSL